MKGAAFALVALALGALGCAPAGGVPGEALGDPITERLVMAPYPAATPWQQVRERHTREGTSAVWIPAAQDLERARDLLTQRIVFGRRAVTASELATELAQEIARACEGARVTGPRPGSEDGNDVAYADVSCSLGQGATQDALVLLKAIRGHEALYVAQREFRFLPSAAELREANAYLANQVYLCPVARPVGRCAGAEAR